MKYFNIIILLVFFTSCKNNEGEKLIGEYYSFMKYADMISEIDAITYKTENQTVCKVYDYSHLNRMGELDLFFIKGYLAQVVFTPINSKEYNETLRLKFKPLVLDNRNTISKYIVMFPGVFSMPSNLKYKYRVKFFDRRLLDSPSSFSEALSMFFSKF